MPDPHDSILYALDTEIDTDDQQQEADKREHMAQCSGRMLGICRALLAVEPYCDRDEWTRIAKEFWNDGVLVNPHDASEREHRQRYRERQTEGDPKPAPAVRKISL